MQFDVLYRSCDRTLTETEVEPVRQQARDTLVENLDINKSAKLLKN
jgi:phenylalanyl-tRNA synthetase beta subunit